jgi:hypothetical protein
MGLERRDVAPDRRRLWLASVAVCERAPDRDASTLPEFPADSCSHSCSDT